MEAQLGISYNQILSLVRQLPTRQKIELSRELEKESIASQLSSLLNTFYTEELSLDTINQEVELVRQQIYDSKRHQN